MLLLSSFVTVSSPSSLSILSGELESALLVVESAREDSSSDELSAVELSVDDPSEED